MKEGRKGELKGHISDCSDAKEVNNYSNILKEVAQYVGTKYKYSRDIRYLVENLELTTIKILSDLALTTILSKKEIWKPELSEYVKRKTHLRENMTSFYSLIRGQYS